MLFSYTHQSTWRHTTHTHTHTHTHTQHLHPSPFHLPQCLTLRPKRGSPYSRWCRVCVKGLTLNANPPPHPNTHSHTLFISKKSLIFLFPSNAIISWKQNHQGVQFDQFISQPTFPSLSEVTYTVVHMHQYAGGFMKIISLPPVSQWKWMSIKDDITQALTNSHEQLWPIREAQLSCNVSYESSRLMHTHTHTHTRATSWLWGKQWHTAHLTHQ